MIIKFPTGLYKSILPQGVESGNITYTISNNDPPRTFVRLVQLPVAEELQPAPDKIFDDEERRAQFGELIYTIATSSRSDPGSNTKLFEIGQVLEFEENPPEEEIQTLRAPEGIDIRHDTNMLDLEAAGLTQEEIDLLISDSQAKLAEFEKEYLNIQTDIKNLKTQITENQKKINETTKTIRAVREINGIPAGDLNYDEGIPGEIYQKLLSNLAALELERDERISELNVASADAESVYRSIIRTSELVR